MINQEFIQKTITENISAREQEVFGYEFNIKNFEMMIERLPPADASRTECVLEAAKHDFRDELIQRLAAERIQLQRAQLILDVLLSQQGA